MGIGAKSEVVRTQTGLSPQYQITTTDRAKAVPLSSPLLYVCLTCILCVFVCVRVCFALEVGVCFVLRLLLEFFLTYLGTEIVMALFG